jgi:hypothetical protein
MRYVFIWVFPDFLDILYVALNNENHFYSCLLFSKII